MRAMILAAGRGKRMAHLTARLPKPLIELAGKPLIVHRLEQLRIAGFKEIVINLAYRGAQIRERLGDGAEFGVTIEYSMEPPDALDTGGGISAALSLLGDEPFLVVNADIWTDFDFATLTAPEGDAHIVLVPNPPHNPAGDFCLENGRVVLEGDETMTFAGIGVYQPALFSGARERRYGLGPVLRETARAGLLSGEAYAGTWIDVGTPERLNFAKTLAALHQRANSRI